MGNESLYSGLCTVGKSCPSLEGGVTITTISEENYAKNCHETTIDIFGAEDFEEELINWQMNNEATAETMKQLRKYSDGYQATMSVIFSKMGVANKFSGSCMTIGVSTQNGGICLVGKASVGNGSVLAQNGVQVIYFPGNMW